MTIEYTFHNYNPPHVFDCTDKNLEERLTKLIEDNAVKTLALTPDMHVGFINPDFIEDWGSIRVKVKARECGDHGKPLSPWKRIVYLITGRYWL